MQRVNLSTIVVTYRQQGSEQTALQLPTLSVDSDFFRTYGIPVIAGRNFSDEQDQSATYFDLTLKPGSTQESRALVNATAARSMGFAQPADALGKRVTTTSVYNGSNQTFTIIGVVGDTQFFGLRTPPRAELYLNTPYFADVLTIRYRGSEESLLQQVTGIWNKVTDGAVLSDSYVDQLLEAEFARERLEARILVSFALIAIIVACLGLFGSAAYNIERRTREIGIRKVMGAEVREIVSLLVWQFSKPVLLANVIAWPVVLWAMLTWLQQFPYRIDIVLLPVLCASAGLLALLIAWVTVGGTAAKAANQKPVLALRYE